MQYFTILQYNPEQKFNRDLGEIGEISQRYRRDLYCRRDLDEISLRPRRDKRDLAEISPRSRQDKRDLAEMPVESGEMVDGKNEGRSDNEEGTPQVVKRKTEISARFVMSLRSRLDLAEVKEIS